MNEYSNYMKFLKREDVDPFENILIENQIKFNIIETKKPVAKTTISDTITEYWLRISESDFEKVDKLVENDMLAEKIAQDHYLNDFSNEELIEIIEHFDEWNKADLIKARIILKERGKNISDEEIQLMKEQRIVELGKPETAKRGWIIAGYLFAFLGGFIAIVIGVSISNSKKNLPNGKKVYCFDEKSRRHAKYILLLGILIIIVGFIIEIIMVI
jgi:hypothetical protein